MARYELLPDGSYKIIDDNNKKIMAEINAGKGIPPIPDDSKAPDLYYDDGSYSCITAMEKCFGKDAVQSFCLCNAFKYLWRCQKKHNTPIQDIKKARWYLDKIIADSEVQK